MDLQREFDFPRQTKLRALERVVCSDANIKGLLKALDGFSQDDRTCTVTKKKIAISMGVSPKTVQRAVLQAESEGLIIVYGKSEDGRANTYRINWVAVFDLPDGIDGGLVKMNAKRRITPGQVDQGPRTSGPPTQDKLTRDPGQLGGGSRDILSRVSGTVPNDPNDTVRPLAQIAAEIVGRSVGGGKSLEEKRKADWIDEIDASLPPIERKRIFEAAVKAKLLRFNAIDFCRTWVICDRAKRRPPEKITGYVISKIHHADGESLKANEVVAAAANLRCHFRIAMSEDEQRRAVGEMRLVTSATEGEHPTKDKDL